MTSAIFLFALLAGNPSWNDFSDWFRREGTPGPPAEVVKAYGVRLRSSGLTEQQAQTQLEQVQEHIRTHPREALALHFDRMYSWKDAPFNRGASALLKKVASSRKPGRALDIAMGQGRNAIWLAKAGWTVSGYDISEEGLRQANAAAAGLGLKLNTKLASHEEFEFGESQWDLIVMSFAFTRLSDGAFMKRVRDSLKPGGVLLVEGFNGGPPREPNMILKNFLDYRVLSFEDLPDFADWANTRAPLLRMALEKP